MKLIIALHENGQDSKVYLLKPWKRSSSGFLWKSVFDGPLSDATRVAKSLADFLNTSVFDAVTLSGVSKPEVAAIV
jgi:hypothetical protein